VIYVENEETTEKMGKKMEETYVRRWRNDDLDLICVL
jgi:hypothetical protein